MQGFVYTQNSLMTRISIIYEIAEIANAHRVPDLLSASREHFFVIAIVNFSVNTNAIKYKNIDLHQK